MTDPATITLLIVAFFTAGTVKGVIGMGMPTIALGFMTLVLDPRLAISIIIVPMVILNIWQVWRSGETKQALLRYLPFAMSLIAFVAIFMAWSATFSTQVIYIFMGISILIFVAINATNLPFSIPDNRNTAAQIGFGSIAGIIGGVSALWAPPMAIYLTARKVDKDEFVRATGLLIFLGCLPLVLGHAAKGALTLPVFVTAMAMLVPSFVGFSVGEFLRSRISEKAFRGVLLIAFLLMGLNLIRRGLF